eukprot:1045013-Heterocapsa_arctica.AAC.1
MIGAMNKRVEETCTAKCNINMDFMLALVIPLEPTDTMRGLIIGKGKLYLETTRCVAVKCLVLMLQKPWDMFTHMQMTRNKMVATLALNTVNGNM